MLGDSLYLENIQEYVQDEDKIVTYKWLSRKLDVPVNAAKQMLYAYKMYYKDTEAINVTYVVSGVVGSNGNTRHEVCIVNEPNLEDTKQRFNKLLSVHVYSVQKAYLKDSSVLFAADYDVTKGHIGDYSKWSTIDCPMSTRLSTKRAPVSEVPTETPVAKLPKLSHHIKQEKEEALQHSTSVDTTSKMDRDVNKQVDAKKNSSKGKPKVQHGRGTVASLFARQTQNGSDNRKESVKLKVKVEPSSNSDKDIAKTDVVQLVSPKKSPHKSPAKRGRPRKTKEPSSKRLTGIFKGLGDSDIEDSESDEEPPKNKKLSTSKQTKEDKKKEVAYTAGGEMQLPRRGDPQQRKRKRVQDLSSDEEELEERRAQRTRVESGFGGNKVKRRKRYKKMVSKMFTNNEGEMVTERVWEMVSADASEGEEDEEVKPNKTELHVKTEKHSPPKQTKQASLRSFFKR